MSRSNITNVTAVLGAITPNPNSRSNEASQTEATDGKETRPSNQATQDQITNPHIDPRISGNSIVMQTQSNQKSKESVDKDVNKESNSTNNAEFKNLFGTSLKLPKFTKISSTNATAIRDIDNTNVIDLTSSAEHVPLDPFRYRITAHIAVSLG
ncbi:hypothetical protein DFH28DRAFT_1121511 [Melampsora americana]|nr:hypothetical protein DFH28DRAFT_1121511 [Melampsora americana]